MRRPSAVDSGSGSAWIARWRRWRGPALGGLVAAFLVAGLCLFHFVRHFSPGDLSAEEMDTVQAARYLAQTGHFGTFVLRPLLAGALGPFQDGALPDLGHQPLFQILAAIVIKALHHTSIGQGDRDVALVSVLLYVGSIAVCFLLARRFFPPARESGLSPVAILAIVFYVLSTGSLSNGVRPSPIPLATLLFSLLLLTLYALDAPSAFAPPPAASRQYILLILAGAVYGLLFLTIYSALLLLPVLLFYLWQVLRRELGPPIIFLFSALVIIAPLLFRNWHATGYPFYHAHLLDLLANTDTYTGYGLYRNAALITPVPQYLASGGIYELVKKSSGNLLAFYTKIPAVFGVFLLPLFLGAALIRFTDGRVNRFRGLIYVCMGIHILGLSFFQTVDESAPVLLIYAPIVATFGSAFLLTVIRARNWPIFLTRITVGGWTLLACIPGLVQLFLLPAPTNRDTVNSNVYYHLNTDSTEMQAIREKHAALLASDAPWDIAYRCNYPTLWLPVDTGVYQAMEERFDRPVGGVVLTSKLRRDYANDPDAEPYIQVAERLLSLSDIVSKLDRDLREKLVDKQKIYYPPRISDALQGYEPRPLLDDDGVHYSLLLWNRPALKALEQEKAKAGETIK